MKKRPRQPKPPRVPTTVLPANKDVGITLRLAIEKAVENGDMTYSSIARRVGSTTSSITRFAYGDLDVRLETASRLLDLFNLEIRKAQRPGLSEAE